jgi:hypothetical protein
MYSPGPSNKITEGLVSRRPDFRLVFRSFDLTFFSLIISYTSRLYMPRNSDSLSGCSADLDQTYVDICAISQLLIVVRTPAEEENVPCLPH